MAISLVQTTSNESASASTIPLTFGAPVTAASVVYVAFVLNNGIVDTPIPVVTDTASNSYNLIDSHAVSTGLTGFQNILGTAYIYAAYTVAGGFTAVTVGSQLPTLEITGVTREYSGLASLPSDGEVSSFVRNTNTPNSTALATTYANDLLIGTLITAYAPTVTAGATFGNLVTKNNSGAQALQISMEDRIVAATGSYTADFSTNININSWTSIFALKDSGATNKRALTILGVGI